MKKFFIVILLLTSFDICAGQVVTAVVQAFSIFMGELQKAEFEECKKTHTEQECREGIKPQNNSYPVSNGYVPQTSPVSINNQSHEPKLSMEQAKIQCKDIGYKYGTEKFGNCVLELMK